MAEQRVTRQRESAPSLRLPALMDGRSWLAVMDGNGWKRRDALVQTLEATRGLTFSLANLELILDVPEVAELRGTG
jgi:hypothetical protein